MEYLARLNIVTVLMSPAFWINLAIVFFVTLITYWLTNRLLNFVYKTIQQASKKEGNSTHSRFIAFDILKRTNKLLLFIAAFLFSLRFVDLPDRLFSTISHIWFLSSLSRLLSGSIRACNPGCAICSMRQDRIKIR